MNAIEIGKLLSVCAAFDRRKTGETDVIAWAGALGHLDYADCEAAVIAHYSETDTWIMPKHVRSRVKALRNERITRAPHPEPPDEVIDNPVAYVNWLRGTNRRAAGTPDLRAIEASTPLPPAPIRQPNAVATLPSHLSGRRRTTTADSLPNGAEGGYITGQIRAPKGVWPRPKPEPQHHDEAAASATSHATSTEDVKHVQRTCRG